MKPTFRMCFSDELPNRPGLWVNRRNNFIAVMQVEANDIERNKRAPGWLNGEWGAHIELVDRDLVPLDRKKVQERLDTLISNANKNAKTEVLAALQEIREDFIGSKLELPASGPVVEPEPVG